MGVSSSKEVFGSNKYILKTLKVIAISKHLTEVFADNTSNGMLSYQSILQNELLARRRKNPSYSVRSFARDLDLSSSFLTQILNQKRKLSDEKAVLIAEKLKLKPSQRKIFVNLVRLDLTRDERSRKILEVDIKDLLKKHPNFTLLSQDTFNIVADWYYFALLELTSLKSFKSDPEWIAKKLNVPLPNIREAIERLKRVGLIAEIDGRLRKIEKDYLFENQKIPSSAIRKHHHQTLSLASTAIEKQSLGEREFFTVSFPLDPKSIGRAKERIREFSEKLMSEMQETEPKAIYKLAVQFFRLDKESV